MGPNKNPKEASSDAMGAGGQRTKERKPSWVTHKEWELTLKERRSRGREEENGSKGWVEGRCQAREAKRG